MTQKSLGKTPSRQINPALHSTLQTTLDPATPTQPLSTLPHLLCRTYCNQAYTRPYHTYSAALDPATPTLPRSTLPHLLCRTYCNQAYTRPCHTYPVVPTLSRLPHLSRLARLG
jgi:hypothetical protein